MIEVNVETPPALIASRNMEELCRRVYRYLHIPFTKRIVSVVWISKARIKILNRAYRGNNCPTNSLSFTYPSRKGVREGELVFCSEAIRTEARGLHIPPRQYAIRLLIHGLLHIEGYEHELKKRREKMEKTEWRILRKLGINPKIFF